VLQGPVQALVLVVEPIELVMAELLDEVTSTSGSSLCSWDWGAILEGLSGRGRERHGRACRGRIGAVVTGWVG
jgi:hypothetical protein